MDDVVSGVAARARGVGTMVTGDFKLLEDMVPQDVEQTGAHHLQLIRFVSFYGKPLDRSTGLDSPTHRSTRQQLQSARLLGTLSPADPFCSCPATYDLHGNRSLAVWRRCPHS